MDAFWKNAQNINTIEEATTLLWSIVDNPSDDTKKALSISIKEHKGQFRKSGEPYIVHPILVGAITAKISGDQRMVQSALLHDTVEDTTYSIEQLKQDFNEEVAHLVEGLTKITDIRDNNLNSSDVDTRSIKSALSFRKMLIASIQDVRVLVIKLCDRMHNMLTLDSLSLEKQTRIAKETMLVYAPIAHRLGISKLKNRLEDLSFRYIYPKEYKVIDDYMNSNNQNLQLRLNSFIQNVESNMLQNGFIKSEFEIFGRVKHYYSIYLKMQRKGVSIEEVLDLLAIRIIVNKDIDCYKILGIVHLKFTPIISRFKDYISVPKENGYKTIHTTLFNDEGIVEAQIRTKQMHDLAEYGVAAHWKYKGDEKQNEVKLDWLESMHYSDKSAEEFYNLAKYDLFSEDITVFSPKGDYYTLPKGSVALDFAYAIHSEVGQNALSALVNKQKSSLLNILKNGDIVNIIKDDKPHIYCSWIDNVQTSKAKHAIKIACRDRVLEIDTISSYNILSTLLNIDAIELAKILDIDTIDKISSNIDIFKDKMPTIASKVGKKELHLWKFGKNGYKIPKIKHIDHLTFFTNKNIDSVEFDYCCHPKVEDEIVAFHKDNKVIIHHKMCKNSYKKIKNHENMIFVKWSSSKIYKYRLSISLQNKKGILADLLKKLYMLNVNVLSIELGIADSQEAKYCQIEIESKENKKYLKDKITKKFKLIDIINLNDAYNK